jgi:hypothetical protein
LNDEQAISSISKTQLFALIILSFGNSHQVFITIILSFTMAKLVKLVGQENDDRVAHLKLCWAGFKLATTDKRPTYELKKKQFNRQRPTQW